MATTVPMRKMLMDSSTTLCAVNTKATSTTMDHTSMPPTVGMSARSARREPSTLTITAPELLVGFHKVDSGRLCMSWSESVDEALCFGWIDGVRWRIDDGRIRSAPGFGLCAQRRDRCFSTRRWTMTPPC
jgi:hypothetical protein